MTTFGKTFRTGMTAALLLVGLTTGAQGFATGGGSGFGGSRRGPTILTGSVLCAGCSLEEVRKTQPDQQLYQFTHKLGQVVMRVRAVDSSPAWRYFAWPPEIRVRAQDRLFQQLTAEENLAKEVEITGLFSTTRALDIFAVTIKGEGR
jgi:hypothetical protein